MPISTLSQLALSKIPYAQIQQMSLQHKTVIHYELFPVIQFPRGMQQTPLYQLCDCINFGRCLCYLSHYRQEMLTSWWGDPDDFIFLSGWMPL